MFSVNIKKIKLDSAGNIEKRLGIDTNGKAMVFFRDEVARLCDPYVPMNTGTLKNTKTYPNSHSIKYVQPYAHYMYKGKVAMGSSKPAGVKRSISNKPIKYQGAPKRGAKWDKRMMNDKGSQVERDVQNFIKRGGK